MTILITGGTGLVGKALTAALRSRGHDVSILTRKKSDKKDEFYWNLNENFIDDNAFKNLDCIIHLAGASVSKRWSDEYKRELYNSRIKSAELLQKYCLQNNVFLKSFVSASGINFYGTFTSAQILTEDSGILKDDFLSQLSARWEEAAERFNTISDRIVCLRTAMVLSNEGGAFPLLENLVDYNLASPVGTGKQWMNWIHLDDMVAMYVFAVENENIKGSYNAVADEIPTNEIFMRKLAKQKNKVFLPVKVPAFLMKLIFGEMSSIILEGTRASNKKIKSQGFDFKYSAIKDVFKNLT